MGWKRISHLGLLGVLVVLVEAVELGGDAEVGQQLAAVPRVLRQNAVCTKRQSYVRTGEDSLH